MKQELLVARRRINLLLDSETVAEARSLGINLSRTVERALVAEIKQERDRRWGEENRAWIAAFSEWYEQEGDPLARLEPL